ncbi:MAG: cytochrome c3 family protein [Chloroflexi bacterium]|nr:cytochrome c3 family protein [Chloroflexota bacterium]MBU1751124.1 cytochrome c3 family protein [Chloroflexota bacterium]MBU1878783.1 cytochrome c3 family protein [Chloroflexota bacterium]
MKVLLSLAAGLLLFLLLPAGLALADNGPHGGYTATTDACAGCHRAHTAPAARLLLDTVPDLCQSCHGSAGSGADTNVEDGLDTSVNRSLRGGGFVNVTMDADLTGLQVLPVTSNHEINGGSNTVWGYGSINATPDPGTANVALTCTNCHNPHGRAGAGGTATYRILKGSNAGNTPLFSNSSGTVTKSASVDIPDDPTKTYYTGANGDYFGDHGSNIGGVWINAALTAWCAQCHSRHKAENTEASPSNSGSTDSGDAVFSFRHATNIEDDLGCGMNGSCHNSSHGNFMPPYPACITCHIAHGTGVRMGAYSDNVPWPDGTTTPGADARSALLRLDNRGVCQDCHNK